jgi:hypothetical protein
MLKSFYAPFSFRSLPDRSSSLLVAYYRANAVGPGSKGGERKGGKSDGVTRIQETGKKERYWRFGGKSYLFPHYCAILRLLAG